MSATLYIFAWGNNERRAQLKGRECRVLERGGKGTVLIEFTDNGERVTCSFRALRRRSDRLETPLVATKPAVPSPSAPVTGIAGKAVNACSEAFPASIARREPDFVTAGGRR